MRTSILALLVGAVALPACAPVVYDYGKEPDPRRLEYVIGPSDRVKVSVWKNPDLSADAVVRPDGTITIPVLGDFQVNGRTPSQLKEEVRQRLSAYVRDEGAVVTVAVAECNNYRFTVAGQVEKPGVYVSKHYLQLAEAIALAGGLSKFASPRDLVILRLQPGQPPRKIPVDFRRVSSGTQPEANLAIMPGDTIFAN